MDRVRSLRKIPMGLHGTKFFTSLTRFTLSVVTQPNSPKCTQIINTPKHEFRVQWGGSGVFVAKIPTRLRGTKFCTSLTRFALSVIDRGGEPDLSMSGDKFDLAEDDPHDPTTTSEPEALMQSLNQLPVVTDLVDARSA